MTEKQIRNKVISIVEGWVGCKESDGSHKQIIDTYNNHKPLARGYRVKYTDAWCATTVSATAIVGGYTDIIPTECGCEEFVKLAKAMGIWVENDAYVPDVADIILYDWDDSGVGDNTGYTDHIGFVKSVSGSTMKIIEGNKNDAVGYRTISVNGRYIRGYVTPNYASKATSSSGTSSTGTTSTTFKVGDKVKFTGTVHYTSSSKSATGHACKSGQAKVTAVNAGSAHPYHLVAVTGKGSTVYGWVNENTVKAISKSAPKVGDKITVTGYYYENGNGGTKKKLTKKTMYVTELVSSKTYKYYIGISPKKGGERWGWIALSSIV